jgi:spermidine synthase
MTAGEPRVELLRDLDRETGWVLLVDGVEQSYVDDADPTHLEFEYMQHFALVIDAVLERPAAVRVVHLGGGALAMPRWVAATRPGSRQVVVEASREVLRVAGSLGAVPACRVVVGDAVGKVSAMRARMPDLVVWDLYDGPRAVTASLTMDAIQVMHRLLRPGGLLLLNVSDVRPFDVVRPVLAALLAVCDDVVLLAEPSTLRGRRSGNCVLAGSVGRPLPVRALTRAAAAAPVRARVVAGPPLAEMVGSARPATADTPLPLPDATLGRAFL